MAQDDPKLSAQKLNDSLKDIGVVVSERTVKRTLNKNDLYGRRPRRKPLLKNKHKEARPEFAKKYVHSPNSFWDDVIFTDEIKGPFPLRAWKRAFFVCFIDIFCARFNFNRSLQSKINKKNKECSFPHS